MNKSEETSSEIDSFIDPWSHMIVPIQRNSMSITQWLFNTYFPNFLGYIRIPTGSFFPESTEYRSFTHLINTILLRSYGFDGYDFTSNSFVSADGRRQVYLGETLPVGLLLASFFGLPTRVFKDKYGFPYFTFRQLLKNFIGGWNFFTDRKKARVNHELKKKEPFKKKGWELAALPLKFLIILPLKILLVPFKFLLNVLKIFTEVLPAIISFCCLILVYAVFDLYKRLGVSSYPLLLKGIIYPLHMALVMVGILVQYTTVWLVRIGWALTSPEKSARLAYASGRSITVSWLGETGNTLFSRIMGGLGAALSLTLSAVLWTFLLPLSFGALTTLFPSLLSAFTWLSTIIVISKSFVFVNQIFHTIGAAFLRAVGPLVLAIAHVVSLQVPTVVLGVGTALGIILPTVVAISSRIADELSNFWARWLWKESYPIKGFVTKGHENSENSKSSTNDESSDELRALAPRPLVRDLVNDFDDAMDEGSDSDVKADRLSQRIGEVSSLRTVERRERLDRRQTKESYDIGLDQSLTPT